MRFVERKNRLEYLLELTEKGRFHSLKQIAYKFDCSERTVKRMVSELREDGYDIYYCRSSRRFFSEKD